MWYHATAAHLATAGEYGPGRPSAWFPPGYAFFLATVYRFFGHSQLAGKLANAVLGAVACGLVPLLGRDLVGRSAALSGGLLAACWPNLIFHTSILSSDVLATLCFVAIAYSSGRVASTVRIPWPEATFLGLLIGAAVLTRPVAGILLVTVGVERWRSVRSFRRAFRFTAAIALLATLPAMAWTVRNYRQFGAFVPISTNGGYNFWQSNNRYADGTDTFWWKVPPHDPEFDRMWKGDELVKNREGYRYGLAYLRSHPVRLLAMVPYKSVRLYGTDMSGLYEAVLHAPMERASSVADGFKSHYALAQAVTLAYYIAVVSLAGVAVFADTERRASSLMLLLPPLLLLVFHVFFHVKDRFHVPVLPFIALLGGLELVRLFDPGSTRRDSREMAS